MLVGVVYSFLICIFYLLGDVLNYKWLYEWESILELNFFFFSILFHFFLRCMEHFYRKPKCWYVYMWNCEFCENNINSYFYFLSFQYYFQHLLVIGSSSKLIAWLIVGTLILYLRHCSKSKLVYQLLLSSYITIEYIYIYLRTNCILILNVCQVLQKYLTFTKLQFTT